MRTSRQLFVVAAFVPILAATLAFPLPRGGNDDGDDRYSTAAIDRLLDHLRRRGRLGPEEALSDRLRDDLSRFRGRAVLYENGETCERSPGTEIVCAFQRNESLPVTGSPEDPSTVDYLRRFFCDADDASQAIEDGRAPVRTPGLRSVWSRYDLSYDLSRFPSYRDDVDRVALSREFDRAARAWTRHTRLSLREAGAGERADLHASFVRIDGRRGIVGRAYFPEQGVVLFDRDETWSVLENDPERVDFYRVAVHEIGHALGLHHVTDRESIMNPTYGNLTDPTEEDVRVLQSAYGTADATTTTIRNSIGGEEDDDDDDDHDDDEKSRLTLAVLGDRLHAFRGSRVWRYSLDGVSRSRVMDLDEILRFSRRPVPERIDAIVAYKRRVFAFADGELHGFDERGVQTFRATFRRLGLPADGSVRVCQAFAAPRARTLYVASCDGRRVWAWRPFDPRGGYRFRELSVSAIEGRLHH